ncbi:MAG: CDP-alcohol phosphatidyltransferase family protein, partial [Promethearchaeota archaeon]
MNKTWIPTLFNVIRIFATPIVIYFILSDPNLLFVGILFVLVACTDMLDGVLARKLKVVNEKGARLDQVADRIFFTSVIFALIFKLLISKGNNISI